MVCKASKMLILVTVTNISYDVISRQNDVIRLKQIGILDFKNFRKCQKISNFDLKNSRKI